MKTDNRIFSKDACNVCGRLGEPHAEWCDEIGEWLRSRPTPQQIAGRASHA